MKKRILALALAGTTAFSVFGGLNVFAAANDEVDAYKSTAPGTTHGEYTTVTLALKQSDGTLKIGGTELDASSWDTFKAAVGKLVLDPADTVAKDSVYLYDYAPDDKTDTEDFEELEDILDTIADMDDFAEDGIYAEDAIVGTVSKAVKDYIDEGADVSSKEYSFVAETNVGAYASSARTEVYATFTELQKDIKDNYVDGLYTTETMEKYNAEALIEDIQNATSSASTSLLNYYVQEYDRLFGEGLVEEDYSTDKQELYYKWLEYVETAVVEDDYTATQWARVQVELAEAAADAEKGTEVGYKNAYDHLMAVLDMSTGKTPDYTEIKNALADLFEDGKIQSEYTGKGTCVYEINDYKVNGKVSDAWIEFVGGKLDGETIKGAYVEAYKLYAKSLKTSTKKNVGQTRLDIAVENLENAIAALDPNYTTSDWAVLKLEEAVTKGEAVLDTDYRTNTTKWKAFAKELEDAQEMLDEASAKNTKMSDQAEDLLDAIKALKDVRKSIPAADKTSLKNLLKEAKELIKETEDKTGEQVANLKTAMDDGQKVYSAISSTSLISEVEGAIADLEAAIAGYEHPQGWYQNDAGTWFYGVGTENYTGWLELNGRTYFLKDDGSMAASTWVKTDKGYWYYLNASGAMMHDGWAKINDTWYYFKNFGGMAEGWVKDGNTWYYLTPGSGAMVSNGWSLINGKYYYFTESGAMLANTTTPDGYKVDASGAWVK